MTTTKNQQGILARQAASIHKNTPTPVVHKVNEANTSLPYDIAGGGNQPYQGPVKNKAQGGLPPGTSAGNAPLPSTGKPWAPFTKGK